MNEHVNNYTLIRFEIRIVAADSIRDPIRRSLLNTFTRSVFEAVFKYF